MTAIGQSPISRSFYLTGGTALAAFFLYHRYSVDLDFFTDDPTAVSRVAPEISLIAEQLGAKLIFTRTLGTFLECFLQIGDGERLKLDFAQASPYRLQPVGFNELYQVQVENIVDISCNKLSALFDRAEPKDFVDVYFLCQDHFPFSTLVAYTRQKHVGIDDYWLAVAIQRVRTVDFLPQMIRPLTIEQLREFFLNQAAELMQSL